MQRFKSLQLTKKVIGDRTVFQVWVEFEPGYSFMAPDTNKIGMIMKWLGSCLTAGELQNVEINWRPLDKS